MRKIKKQEDSTKNLESLTHQKLMKMNFLEFEGRIWLVFDPKSKRYLAFNGHTNQSYHASSFQKVKSQFNKLTDYYKK